MDGERVRRIRDCVRNHFRKYLFGHLWQGS